MEYYLTVKRNTLLIHAITWINLKLITLSKSEILILPVLSSNILENTNKPTIAKKKNAGGTFCVCWILW